MNALDVISTILLGLGALVMLLAAAGVVRFPDIYTRLHAAGKGDTLGQGLILIGLSISAGFSLISLKLALIVFFVFIFNPTATHALARGAWVKGLVPWTNPKDEVIEEDDGAAPAEAGEEGGA